MTESATSHVQVESIVTRTHRHGRRLVLPIMVLFAIVGASGYWVGALPEAWMNLAAAIAAAAIALVLGVLPILFWLAGRVTLTTRRVIVRRGLFVQHRSEVPLARVREVRTRRGPLQHLFGSGNIELLSGPEVPLVLRDVPGVKSLVAALNELVEENYARGDGRPFGAQGATAGFGTHPVSPVSDLTTALPRG